MGNDVDKDEDRPIIGTGTGAADHGGTIVDEQVLPLVEESLAMRRRTVETGTVKVRTVLQHRDEVARAEIFRHAVSVEHVPINREIDAIPEPWEDGDVLVIPVVEEVLVVEKRLMLREELRVQRRREADHIEQPVTLRSMQAVVERRGRASETPALESGDL
jgi:uncharacterized protein (TIGR02271 family)